MAKKMKERPLPDSLKHAISHYQVKRMPEIGDIVAVRWKDHFVFKGDKIPEGLEIITWGKYDYVDENGIAIVQSEVQTGGQDVERRMDTQFILHEGVLEIKKL